MKIISESSGFALWFHDENDLDKTIDSLQKLKAERAARPSKSWPAFHAEIVARPGGDAYFAQLLRWLRSRLHKDDPSKFSD